MRGYYKIQKATITKSNPTTIMKMRDTTLLGLTLLSSSVEYKTLASDEKYSLSEVRKMASAMVRQWNGIGRRKRETKISTF